MLEIELPHPPSVNKMFANQKGSKGGRFKTKAYKDWIKEAGFMLLCQRNRAGKYKRPAGKLEVEVDVLRINKLADIDNTLKAVLDLLVSTSTIEDDRHVERVTAQWVHDGVPCVVRIKEFQEAA